MTTPSGEYTDTAEAAALRALLVPLAVECETVQRDADLTAWSLRDERAAKRAHVVRGIE